MLQFRHMGGALARQTPGAGALATLPGQVSMLTLGVVPDEHAQREMRAAVAGVEAAVLVHRDGHYPNFVEKPADASTVFDADTWTRLRTVKARYDANDLFAGNHHIPSADRMTGRGSAQAGCGLVAGRPGSRARRQARFRSSARPPRVRARKPTAAMRGRRKVWGGRHICRSVATVVSVLAGCAMAA